MFKKSMCYFIVLSTLFAPAQAFADNGMFNKVVYNTPLSKPMYEWETIIEPKWDSVQKVGNFFQVQDGQKYGLMDSNGKAVFVPQFDKIIFSSETSALGQRKKSNSINEYVGIDGRVAFSLPSSTKVEDFYKGQAIVKEGTESLGFNGTDMYVTQTKAGVIDAKGKIIIPMAYAGLRRVVSDNNQVIYIAWKYTQKNSLETVVGLLNQAGKVILPFQPIGIQFNMAPNSGILNDGLIIAEKNSKYGCIDLTGKVMIPFVYDEIEHFENGSSIAKKNGKYGVIDKKGKAILPFQHDSIVRVFDEESRSLYDGYEFKPGKKQYYGYKVQIGKKFGLLDANWKPLTKVEWDDIAEMHNGLARVTKNRNYGFMDKGGKLIIPMLYEYRASGTKESRLGDDVLDFFGGEIAVMFKNGQFGYISSSGKVISEPQWDDADRFSHGFGRVKKDGKYGFVNKSGKVISEPQWDAAVNFYRGYAGVRKGSMSGIIDENGQVVLTTDMIKDELVSHGIDPNRRMAFRGYFQENYTVLWIEGEKEYYIDRAGKILFASGYSIVNHFENGWAEVYDGPFLDVYDVSFNGTEEQINKLDSIVKGEKSLDLIYRREDWNAPGGNYHVIDTQGNIILSYPKEFFQALEGNNYYNPDLTWDKNNQFPKNYTNAIKVNGKIGVVTLRKSNSDRLVP